MSSKSKSFRSVILIALTCAVVAPLGFVATTVGATNAEAAVGPNPHADITIDRLFDGTGHDTANASFVNGANGYSPGDDTPDDGVVSSHDTVGYKLSMAIHAGPARTIALNIGATDLLSWKSGREAFCASMPGVDMTLSGDTCLMTIRSGATAMIERDIQLLALDSAGAAVGDQKLITTLGLLDMPVYSTVESDPVTVISAPKVDLTFDRSSTMNWSTEPGAGTGSLVIEVVPLQSVGYSPTKGVSWKMPWEAYVDVSSFPEGTTWSVQGKPLEVVDGKILVSVDGASFVGLTYTFPGGIHPEQEPGVTKRYPVHLIVPETSFSSESFLNNGDGTQPGGGKPSSFNTFNEDLGSRAGYGAPNNDYSAAVISRGIPSTGAIFTQRLMVPYTYGVSIYEPGNVRFSETSLTEYSSPNDLVSRGIGSEFTVISTLESSAITEGGVAVLSEAWDTSETRIRAAVTVARDGVALPSDQYILQWANIATNDRTMSDPNVNDGWVSSPNPIPNAQAVRVIFNDGVVMPNTGSYSLTTPLVNRTEVTESYDPMVDSSLRGSIGSVYGELTSSYLSEVPIAPSLSLHHTVSQNAYSPGDTASYTVAPTVINPVAVSNGFQSRITVELDRCVAEPVNTSTENWTMEVIPGVAGPSGRICGDTESTPVNLVFTPAGDPAAQRVNWYEASRNADLPDISYTGRVAFRAVNTIVAASSYDLDDREALVLGVGGVTAGILAQSSVAASMFADFPVTEFDKNLMWTVDLSQQVGNGTGETVIGLPRNNDGVFWDSAIDPGNAYNGERESSFSGGYSVAGLSASADDTSDTVELFFTVDENPSLDPTEGTWHALSAAGTGSIPAIAGATAVKVVTEGGDDFSNLRLHVDLLPDGNAAGDVYLLWVGETSLTGEGNVAPQPWPGEIRVASSAISGNLWWDDDVSETQSSSEDGISDVALGLFPVTDGVIGETPLAETTTDADGTYSFARLYSGTYVVQIMERGPELPNSALSYYNEQIEVKNTYTYDSKRAVRAEDVSSVITLGLDSDVNRVDFGFFQPDPGVDVDKTVVSNVCRAGVCDITWSVDVENTGNTAITNGRLTDVMSASAYDVEAQLTSFQSSNFGSSIAAGGVSGYMLDSEGRAYGWSDSILFAGDGINRVLTPTNIVKNDAPMYGEPIIANLEGVTSISNDGNSAFFIMEDSSLYVVGDMHKKQFLDGSDPYARQVRTADGSPLRDVVDADASLSAGFALLGNGQVYSWGRGFMGALGSGSNANRLSAQPVFTAANTPLTDIVSIDVGLNTVYAVSSTGQVYSWGHGADGRLGNGFTPNGLYATPVLTAESTPLTGIATVTSHDRGAVALAADGSVYSWGVSSDGDINGRGADGSNALFAAPVKMDVDTPLVGVRQIATGGVISNALMLDGSVYAWGSPAAISGVGPDSNGSFARPVIDADGEVLTDAVSIFAGSGVAFALRDDATAFSWGDARLAAHERNGNGDYAADVTDNDGSVIEDIQGFSTTGGLVMMLQNDGIISTWANGHTKNPWSEDFTEQSQHDFIRPMTKLGFEPVADVTTLGSDGLFMKDDQLHMYGSDSSALQDPVFTGFPQVITAYGSEILVDSFSEFNGTGGEGSFITKDGGVSVYNARHFEITGDGSDLASDRNGAVGLMRYPDGVAGSGQLEYVYDAIDSASNVYTNGDDVYTWGASYLNLGQTSDLPSDSLAAGKVIAYNVDAQGNDIESSASATLFDDATFTNVYSENGSRLKAALSDEGVLYTWASDYRVAGHGAVDTSVTDTVLARELQMYDGNVVEPGAIVDVALSSTGSIALTEDGHVLGWGEIPLSGEYYFADPSGESASLLMRDSEPVSGVRGIDASDARMGLVTETGEFLYWDTPYDGLDYDWSGELFMNVATLADTEVLGDVEKLVVRDYNLVALTADGRVATYSTRANMGVGFTENGYDYGGGFEFVRTDAETVLTGVVDVSGSNSGGSALLADGTMHTWGSGMSGRIFPQQADADSGFAALLEFPTVVPFDQAMAMPSNSLSAMGATPAGDFTEREYRMPAIEPGEIKNIVFTAKVNQRTGVRQVIGNQAWFTAPNTPIAGILPEGQISPDAPVLPRFENVDAAGISGNATCNTDADNGGQAVADSCDQVAVALPAVLPGSLGAPGSASGMMWLDLNNDGIKQDDELALSNSTVSLMREGMVRGTTTTDEDGNFLFDTVPSGAGYTVVFDVMGSTPTDEHLAVAGIEEGSFSPTLTLDRGQNQSWMSRDTFSTGEFEVIPGVEEEHLNGGVRLTLTQMSVAKVSTLGDPANLPVDDNGMTEDVDVQIFVDNTGNEALTLRSLTDVTLSGVDIMGLSCDAPIEGFVIQPGDSFFCEATLPSYAYGEDNHVNEVTVVAEGVETGTVIERRDQFTAVAQGEASWSMTKTADPTSGSYVAPGSEITYTLSATNTGDLPLVDASIVDDMTALLEQSSLVGDLDPALQRSGDVVVWNLPEVAPGQSVSVDITVQVNDDLYGATLTNTAYGQGPVAPDTCTADAPCTTEHMTSPWPGALPLPVLGNVAFIVLILVGVGLLGAGVTYVTVQRVRARKSLIQ